MDKNIFKGKNEWIVLFEAEDKEIKLPVPVEQTGNNVD